MATTEWLLGKCMLDTNPAIEKLLRSGKPRFRSINKRWCEAQACGLAPCYSHPLSENYQRINLNADVNHIQKQGLRLDHGNLYECACKAIAACSPESYSTKKAIKDSGANKAKFLINEGLIPEEILLKIQSIQIKRTKDAKRPVINLAGVNKVLEIIKQSSRKQASKELDLILILSFFYLGLRLSEVINLKLEHVEMDNDRIFIQWSKHGKSRWVGIHRDLKPHLEKYLSEVRPTSQNQNVFLLPSGSKLTKDRVGKRIKQLTNQAGFEGGCHQFRRGFATHFHHERNVPLEQLKSVLGHSNIATTMLYIRSSNEEIVKKQVNW